MRFAARLGIFQRRLETEIQNWLVRLRPLGLVLFPEPPLLQLLLPPPLFGEVYASKIGWQSFGHPCSTRAATLRARPD